jgi:hypothetical protein
MKFLHAIFLALTLLFAAGCGQNTMAKSFGGTDTVRIPKDKKFVNITWKQEDMWVLTRKRENGETPTTYYFQEKSNWGIFDGTIIVQED